MERESEFKQKNWPCYSLSFFLSFSLSLFLSHTHTLGARPLIKSVGAKIPQTVVNKRMQGGSQIKLFLSTTSESRFKGVGPRHRRRHRRRRRRRRRRWRRHRHRLVQLGAAEEKNAAAMLEQV